MNQSHVAMVRGTYVAICCVHFWVGSWVRETVICVCVKTLPCSVTTYSTHLGFVLHLHGCLQALYLVYIVALTQVIAFVDAHLQWSV